MKKQGRVGRITLCERSAAEAAKESDHAHQQICAPLSEKIHALKKELESLKAWRGVLSLTERTARIEEIEAELPQLIRRHDLACHEASLAEIKARKAEVALVGVRQRAEFLTTQITSKESELRRLLASRLHPVDIANGRVSIDYDLAQLRTQLRELTGEEPTPAEAA